MGALFAKKPKSRVTEQDKAILQLKQQRDQLKQYQKRLENQLERDREVAKQLIQSGKKERALLLLRKKRFQEQQLQKTDGMLENIEVMTHNIEFAQVEIKIIEGLKAGNVALKQLNELLSIDEIERIMDETKEGIEKQKEIDEILHGQLTNDDEDAVLAELDELLAEDEQEKLDTINALPDAPQDEIIAEERERKVRDKKQKDRVALAAS